MRILKNSKIINFMLVVSLCNKEERSLGVTRFTFNLLV